MLGLVLLRSSGNLIFFRCTSATQYDPAVQKGGCRKKKSPESWCLKLTWLPRPLLWGLLSSKDAALQEAELAKLKHKQCNTTDRLPKQALVWNYGCGTIQKLICPVRQYPVRVRGRHRPKKAGTWHLKYQSVKDAPLPVPC